MTTSMARVHWRTHHGDTSTRTIHWDDVPVLLNDLHDSRIVTHIEVTRQGEK